MLASSYDIFHNATVHKISLALLEANNDYSERSRLRLFLAQGSILI